MQRDLRDGVADEVVPAHAEHEVRRRALACEDHEIDRVHPLLSHLHEGLYLQDFAFYPRVQDEGVVTKSEALIVLPVDVVFLEFDIVVDNLVVEFSVGDGAGPLIDRVLRESK